jgi:DNA end-binding protein Ku
MATIWKGSIAFGLVNVPVELRTAVRAHKLSFRMLSAEGHVPIRFERVREDDRRPVPWDEIVKGYELPDGEFVVLDDKDFDEAAVEQNRRLDILDFVDPDEIDPRFFETPYFLVPSKGGERTYALLREALDQANTVGVGKIVIHRNEHLAAIRVLDNAMEMVLMRFAHELVDSSEYTFPPREETRPEEVKMAVQLIENLRTPFEPAKYKDEYSENLLRIINAKAKGQRITLEGPAETPREGKVLDLMERLQESLKQSRRPPSATKGEPARSKRTRSRKKTA